MPTPPHLLSNVHRFTILTRRPLASGSLRRHPWFAKGREPPSTSVVIAPLHPTRLRIMNWTGMVGGRLGIEPTRFHSSIRCSPHHPRTFLLAVRFCSTSCQSGLKAAPRYRPPVLRYRTCPRSPSPTWASLGLTSPTRHHQCPGIEAGNVQRDPNAAPGRVESFRSARNHALAARFETRL